MVAKKTAAKKATTKKKSQAVAEVVTVDMEVLIEQIRTYHRQMRFAIKMQSRIDRSMESFIRVNVFGFSPMLPEAEREVINRQTAALVKQCRAGEADPQYADITKMVVLSDASRATWDSLKEDREKMLIRLAKMLPAYELCGSSESEHSIAGFGPLGLAQIVGEAGDIANYANPGKLWKRLGLAPYEGLAMSSWKRKTWRPRDLTSEEWVNNPFRPERYACMMQIAQWLWVAQWTGRKKAPPDGAPDGPYGQLYADRRAHTRETHPDWTPMHSHRDALRYIFKRLTREIWKAWRPAPNSLTPSGAVPAAAAKGTAELPMSSIEEVSSPSHPDQQRASILLSPTTRVPAAAPEIVVTLSPGHPYQQAIPSVSPLVSMPAGPGDH